MKKAPLTLTLLVAALASSTALAAPTSKVLNTSAVKRVGRTLTANQKLVASRVSENNLWLFVSKTMAKVSGKITIDEAVLPYITGSCGDVVIKAFNGTNFSDEVASMHASGDISSGQCTYTMFVKPQSDMRLLSFYEGTRNPGHPGDYLEVNGVGSASFAAAAGSTYTKDFVLTYDFIK